MFDTNCKCLTQMQRTSLTNKMINLSTSNYCVLKKKKNREKNPNK